MLSMLYVKITALTQTVSLTLSRQFADGDVGPVKSSTGQWEACQQSAIG